MKYLIYNVNVFSNFFSVTFYDYINNIRQTFIICEFRNDFPKLMDYLEEKAVHIGYYNDNYAYPIIHHIINHRSEYLADYHSGKSFWKLSAKRLFDKSESIKEQVFSVVKDKNKFIFQIDLCSIWGFNTLKRLTSLKDLAFNLNYPDIRELEFDTHYHIGLNDVDTIIEYNNRINDIIYEFFNITVGKTDRPMFKGINMLNLRTHISNRYDLNVMNMPKIKLGEALLLRLYSNFTGISEYVLRNQKTSETRVVELKDCFPEFMKFKTIKFRDLIRKFKSTKVVCNDTKNKFAFEHIYHGVKITYGLGGAHASAKAGRYESDDEFGIYDFDVDSMYPSIAISLGLYPRHLGPIFPKIYDENIVSVRLAEKKAVNGDKAIITSFKFAANAVFGKSNEANSPFYDPLYTYKTTIGGQIFISMWTEALCECGSKIEILSINTDGVTIKAPRKLHDKLIAISNELCKSCGLSYSYNEYKKMIIRDVNNFIAEYNNGKYKKAGCFKEDKDMDKDYSKKIIPIALSKYFLDGIPIENTIKNHNNIYDFCIKAKMTKTFSAIYKGYKDNKPYTKQLTKTTRYYVSNDNSAGKLFKRKKGTSKESELESGYFVQVFNKYEEKNIKEYCINYDYYIRKCRQIINTIDDTQLSLF